MDMRKKITFSEEANKTLVPAWKDYVAHYRAENFAKRGTYDNSKSLADKQEIIDILVDKEIVKCSGIDETSLSNGAIISNPVYKWATFAVVSKLIDSVMPEIIRDDFMNVANVTTVGYGDNVEFEVKSADLFTVVKNGNSRRHVEAQRQYTGTKVLTPVNHSVTTQVDLYKVRANKESLAEFAMKVVMSIESEIAIDIMSCITDSYNTLATPFKETAFSETAFKKLAARVQAANGGAKAVAVGTELALGTILPTNDYLKMGLGEEWAKVGYLPMFKNVPLVGISQKIDWDSVDYDFALSDDYIYILSPQSQKLVQVVLEGDTLAITDDETGNGNLIIRSTLHKRWAVGLITNAKYGIMKVS